MSAKRYNLINNLLGWLCFAIAAVSYLLTIEPTASFWDCPEFISQGYKLEVGHPPGNPIFMLTARFFITVLGSDTGSVAMAVNAMNALLSAGTILLLFWTITHLMRRLLTGYKPLEEISAARQVIIFGSGIVGALAYAWSDTFWFSAVEGEVYAFSSFCTALVFWLILKWESRADTPHSDRYLVLIAYVIGVSIAVHLLNLLCIPAIVLVFYFRKFSSTSAKGSIYALLVSFVIIALILFGLVPGFVEVAQYCELFFVNTLGCPYNSGVIAYTFASLAIFIWTIRELYVQKSATRIKIGVVLSVLFSGIPFIGSSMLIPVAIVAALIVWLQVTKKLPVRILNLTMLSILVIFIGYSSYALLLIRSAADTPINQNAPDNVFALGSYLNREQYGEAPLIYGTTFASEVMRNYSGSAIVDEDIYTYCKDTDRTKAHYVRTLNRTRYKYSPELNTLFPRMYDAKHRSGYMNWGGFTEADMPIVMAQVYENSTTCEPVRKPTFIQNISYFVNYQLVHMYCRYFMWNFAGRQNDLQGNGEVNRGNWISGIPFIDNARLGDQSLLPADFGSGNKGHNVYYMLPLLLGIIGLCWQSAKGDTGIRQFWIVFFLFFMTGIAIVLYLNQTPGQPRERDYAFAGSFYAFAIWIGLGVGALANLIDRIMRKKEPTMVGAIAATAIGLIVPLQMVSQTWDDHDRSGRYTTRDFGMNYLSSLEPDAIIFTNGDNDTFPLWYAQEVEGYRKDVRVINLSYLTTEWYARQQELPAYDAKAVNWLASPEVYDYGRRQAGYVIKTDTTESALKFLEHYYSSAPDQLGKQQDVDYPIVQAGNIYIPGDTLKGESNIYINLPSALTAKNGQPLMYLADMLTIDIIATSAANGWDRPVYFANTVPDSYYLKLDPYLYTTGMAMQVKPLHSTADSKADNDRAFDNIVNRFRWGGLDAEGGEDVYLDETVQRMVSSTRYAILDVVQSLMAEHRFDEALQLLNLMTDKLPAKNTPYGVQTGELIASLFIELSVETGDIDAFERGCKILRSEIDRYADYLPYLLSLSDAQLATLSVADRAVLRIRDAQGYYSYFANLVLQLINSEGHEATTDFLVELSEQKGINLIAFANSLMSYDDYE